MTTYQVIIPFADVHGTPGPARGKFDTQLVFGETFAAEEEQGGWCKGACTHDGYPGYIERQYLAPLHAPHTHIVDALRTHIYEEPTMKSPLVTTLSFGSRLHIREQENGFARLDNGAWIYGRHIVPAAEKNNDYIALAQRFVETPYYWGGRSGFGLDCSGLVQVCLARAGLTAPRDSGDQQEALGIHADAPRRGDLVFFPGHVGFMADEHRLLHANAFHMKTVLEPLADVVARGSEILSIRRLGS